MKKYLFFMLTVGVVLSFSACSAKDTKKSSTDRATSKTYEIALITDYGSGAIDDRSFTQGAWDGIKKYAEEAGKTYQYYRPTEQSIDGYVNGIQMAVSNGAKVVVCPGYLYEAAVFRAQDEYPDVKFILLDGVPQKGDYTEYKTAGNTYSIVFAEEEAGYLAGYAAIKDGYRKLAFMGGMAVPAVVKFGYGFLQGADLAAGELKLSPGEVETKYGYTGNFEPTPENQTKAASWYQSGTQVIFSCGGLILNSVTAAAESYGNGVAVIGVDVDQAGESDTVITSAVKMLTPAIYDGVKKAYEGGFPGGVNARLGVKENMVGLPDNFSRFRQFTKADYEKIYRQMQDDQDGIITNLLGDTKNGKNVSLQEVSALLKRVKIDEIN